MLLLAAVIVFFSLINQAIAQINLRSAAPFGIIASSAITNDGTTVVTGYLGIYPNTESSITGFPPGLSGTIYAGNGVANQAVQDAMSAYETAKSLATTMTVGTELGGRTLVAGIYTSTSFLQITGTLTLDGQNNPDALFAFQIGSTLTTASSSLVVLINGAQACNIFWQVSSSATLGTRTIFNGNILALSSISLNDGVAINGGLYALTGAVTLIDDQVTAQKLCVKDTVTTSTTASSTVFSMTADISMVVITVPDDVITSIPTEEVTTVSTLPITSTLTEEVDTRTTPGIPTITTLLDGSMTTISGFNISTKFTGGGLTVTSPGDDLFPTPTGSTNTDILSSASKTTIITETSPTRSATIPASPDVPSIPDVPGQPATPNVPDVSITRPLTKLSRSTTATKTTTTTKLLRPVTSATLVTRVSTTGRSILPSSFVTPVSINSVHVHTTIGYDMSATGYIFKSSSKPEYTNLRASVATKEYQAMTTMNGETTTVPIAYEPLRSVQASSLTAMSDITHTTTQYYEETCDCLRTSAILTRVTSATTDIASINDHVPCITTSHFESSCSCVRTVVVPVQLASKNATPVAAMHEPVY